MMEGGGTGRTEARVGRDYRPLAVAAGMSRKTMKEEGVAGEARAGRDHPLAVAVLQRAVPTGEPGSTPC